MKKIFLIIMSIFIIWISFAQNKKITEKDCNNDILKYLDNLWNKLNNLPNLKIIKKEDYQVAIKNLKKYCNNDWEVLQSPYFINHLLDVWFRKLDAIDPLEYWITFDQEGIKWREYLNWITEKTKPDDISKNFTEIWGRKNWTWLYSKYISTCKDLKYIDSYIVSQNNWYTITNNLHNKCINLANQRYQEEANLVSSLMIRSFYKRIDTKLYESFFQKNNKSFADKLMKLYDKFTIALWDFQYLVLRFVKVVDANK